MATRCSKVVCRCPSHLPQPGQTWRNTRVSGKGLRRNAPISLATMGRGPTSDMSPSTTLASCGSSSSPQRRRTRPTRVTRGSLGTLCCLSQASAASGVPIKQSFQLAGAGRPPSCDICSSEHPTTDDQCGAAAKRIGPRSPNPDRRSDQQHQRRCRKKKPKTKPQIDKPLQPRSPWLVRYRLCPQTS
jgi:hypothetical protein